MDSIYKILENLKSVTEAPANEKRYLVSIEMYMYAEDDNAVQAQAEDLAEQLRDTYDNQAKVMSIHEQPFATLGSRKLFNKFED
jgi:hypothetical protein